MRLCLPVLVSSLLLVSAGVSRPFGAAVEPRQERAHVRSLRVTILSTMLADQGIGEWGFAALVEADGHRLLFDTGNRPDTVLTNAAELGVELSGVREVILSHNHGDHTGGLLTLRRALAERDPGSLAVAHVGRGIFWDRSGGDPGWPGMPAVKRAYEELGGRVVEHAAPAELHPGVWLTGPVPRVHPERNWSLRPDARVRSPEGLVEDDIPESQSLVIDTDQGLVVVSGCGHAGIVNTLEYARQVVGATPVHAALGGFHLFQASDDHVAWTAGKLREMGLRHLVGAHCTGIEAVFQLRQRIGLSRETAVVGAVGASFSLPGGIDPLALAR
jgi:7,8-dihydropterin-6-yl-methyl-4-(beta-D-ribofuranosyl)aminobenzene 5'-phosphate synthase